MKTREIPGSGPDRSVPRVTLVTKEGQVFVYPAGTTEQHIVDGTMGKHVGTVAKLNSELSKEAQEKLKTDIETARQETVS